MYDLRDLIYENRKLSERLKELDNKVESVLKLIDSEELVPSPTVKLMKIKELLKEDNVE